MVSVLIPKLVELDNLSGSFSLKKADSSALKPFLAYPSSAMSRLCELSPISVCMATSVIVMQFFFKQSYCWDLMCTGLRVILCEYQLMMDTPGYLFSAFWQVVDCLKILFICWKKKLLWWGLRAILLWKNRISKQQKSILV